MAASRLVEVVAMTGDLAERHYLEIKGPLDLSSRVTAAKIAKFILGATNRNIDKASTAFEGCAALAIGVSDSGIVGMPVVEILEIDKKVKPFLGEPGPLWDALWVPIAGAANRVLVIVVDPPKVGQGPFICRKNGEGVQDGRVYLRGDGETREATAGELDSLIQRGFVTHAPDVDFEVQVVGKASIVPLNDERMLEEYINQRKARLLDALPSRNSDIVTSTMLGGLPLTFASSILNFMETPEDRTVSGYLEEIAEWEKRLRTAWPNAILHLLGRTLPSPIVRITNRTSTFLHDVQLKIHLEGDISGAEFHYSGNQITRSDLDLPTPPRRWGPRTNLPLSYPYPYSINQPHTSSAYPSSPPRIRWDNSGSVNLVLDAGALRPLASEVFDEQEFILYTRTPDLNQIRGTWAITARGFNEVFEGELSVAVGETVDLMGRLDAILNPT